MNKIKKILIILVVLLIGILLLLVYCLKQTEPEENEIKNDEYKESVLTLNEEVQEETISDSYYAILNIIQKYVRNLYYITTDKISEEEYITKEEVEQDLYNILTNEYKQNNSITQENISEKIMKVEQIDEININSMKYVEGETVYTYLVDLEFQEQRLYFMVLVDLTNKTYELEPLSKEEYENKITSGYKTTKDAITKNFSNSIIFRNISDQEMCLYYLIDYKKKINSNTQIAYNLLEEEYRNNRFPTLEDFRDYVQNNSEIINKATVSNYKVNYCKGYTQYICQDQYNNYYIFNATAVLNYKVLLDTYTVQIPEYVEYYAKATNEYKVVYNVQNFFNAINSKDYKYAYKVLDETFRTNNFGSIDNFSKYVNQNFYEHNEIIEFTYKIDQDLYICSVKLKDLTNNNTKEIEKTIIMQLKDNSEFVISFNI